MLEPVMFFDWLVMVNTHKFYFYIVILTIDVRISMMRNVVLEFPKIYIPSQKVQGIALNGIDFPVIRKGIVPCIMHDIKPNGSQINAHYYT